jgi:hypothetical protein
MTNEAPIEIKRNRKKLGVYLAVGLIFFVFGLFLVLNPSLFLKGNRNNYYIVDSIGTSIMVASGIFVYIMGARMISIFPGLILSHEDVYVHFGSPGDGLVKWIEMNNIEEVNVHGKPSIAIMLKNPAAYINRQKSPAKRQAMTKKMAQYGSPILIGHEDLDFDFESLRTLLKGGLDRFKEHAV